MRLGISWGFAVGCALGALSCKPDYDPPVYLETEYQLRCLDCQPRTGDEPTREIAQLDGEFDMTIECAVSKISGKRSLKLDVKHKDYGIRLNRVNIDDKAQSSECEVQVVEGANTYRGTCTGDDPGEDTPCKVSFKRDGDTSIVKGSVYCDQITLLGAPSNYRYLVDPGTEEDAAKFEIHNCDGL
ncbi:MAG TPA: hypothetical protein VJR89_40980 [Polyangiales bacterium]|nr:hypothetical protein [Polyangiales bacterium]